MSEKVLGFYEELALRVPNEKSNMYEIAKQNTVSVRLASESVDIKWLEKYVAHIRGCFEKNQPSDFEAGEEIGRIEGLEVLLAEAKKEAKKK